MKIKHDFVTNSSSTSFVMIGFKISSNADYHDVENMIEQFEKKNNKSYYFGFGAEGGAGSDDEVIVGRILVDIDEYQEYKELNFNMDISDVVELAEIFDVSKEDVKFIVSTRMS